MITTPRPRGRHAAPVRISSWVRDAAMSRPRSTPRHARTTTDVRLEAMVRDVVDDQLRDASAVTR